METPTDPRDDRDGDDAGDGADGDGADGSGSGVDERFGYLAIDLSPSRLAAGIVDRDGAVMVRDRVPTPERNVWPVLTQVVRRVLAANPSEIVPRIVGVTCPGPIDRLTGAMKPVGLPLWHDFPIQREVGGLTGLPVAIDTPGRGLALAELWLGESAVVDAPQFATLVIGDDVDGALVVGGRLAGGVTGNLGQFGHLIVEPDGQPCECGATGCLSAYAGALAIERSTGRELRRTPPAIVERTAIMVARGCASLAAMLDVAEIVIGGSVPHVLGVPFFAALDTELEQRSRLSHLGSFRVRGVTTGRLGPLVAAAAVGRRHLLERPVDEPLPEPPSLLQFDPPRPVPLRSDQPAVKIIPIESPLGPDAGPTPG